MTPPIVDFGAWREAGGCLWWEASLGPARLAMSTRLGGRSAPPRDALNLGLHVGDSPDDAIENRRRFWAAAGSRAAEPVIAEQVHGTHVAVVRAAEAGRGWGDRETAVPETDALVTRDPAVAPALLVADCAPVAIVAPGGVLGLAHAGWRGLADGVLEATLREMEALSGGAAREYEAVVGPCIRGCCYEVGEEVWRRFPSSCLARAERPGARRLDMMAAVVHHLREAGLMETRIHPLRLCTACHPDLFFSHRRAALQGLPTTGRMALFGCLA